MTFPSPCPDSDLLKAIMRGSIEAEEQQRIEQHLQACAQCRAVMDLIIGDESQAESVEKPNTDQQSTEVENEPADQAEVPVGVPPKAAEALIPVAADDEEFTEFLKRICRPSATGLGQIGPYEIVECIGRGGMGAVVKARDTRLDRFVAIKFLRPEYTLDISFVDRFLREARTAAAINHPNVVTVHSVEEVGDTPYIVMEFVDGESLHQRLKRTGLLPVDQVARIGSQIAAGLAAAHERKVVHRDIKPENILLVHGTDQVKITDFGLAQADGAIRLTRSGVLLGTPKYMSPEQARGETLDYRTDLFSFGSVLYAMATGQPPFNKRRQSELIKDVAEARVPPIESINPALPDWLTAIVRKLHKKRPVDRFQSARDVSKLLKQHAGRPAGTKKNSRERSVQIGNDDGEADDETVVQAAVEPLLKGLRKTSQKPLYRRWILGLSAIIGVAALSVGVWKFFPTSNASNGQTELVPDVKPPVATEPAQQAEVAPGSTPFVVLIDGKVRRFESLLEAYRELLPGGVITIEANGEVEIPKLRINKPMILKAEAGFHPILVETLEDHLTNEAPLLTINAEVVLEGLEFKHVSPIIQDIFDDDAQTGPESIIRVDGGSLMVAHCRFRSLPGHPKQVAILAPQVPHIELFASEILGGCGVEWGSPSEGRLLIQNSCCAAIDAIRLRNQPREFPASIELLRSAFVNAHAVSVILRRNSPDPMGGLRPLRKFNFRAEDCVFDAKDELFVIHEPPGLPPNSNLANGFMLDRLINWTGSRNLYDVQMFAILLGQSGPTTLIPDFAKWQQSWFGREASSEQSQILLLGNRPTFEPPMVYQPRAFDLRMTIRTPDGTPAGPRGAPLDRIGPGKAYEQWSRSPEAKAWRAALSRQP
jgi:serine/threonine protein kinase